MNRILALLVLLSSMLAGQDQKASEVAQKQVNGIVNWNDEMNSPGARMELRELTRGEKDGGLLVFYDIIVTGTPRDQSYALFYWPITRAEADVVAPKVWIGAEGVCAVRDQCKGSLIRLSFNTAKAEPHRVMLVSKDGKHHVVGMVIPDPINATDQGCSLEVVRLGPKFELALIRGKGFKPKEQVKFVSNSAGEQIDGIRDVNDDGTLRLVLAPFVKGKDTGTDEVTVKGSNCSPVISYKWGTTKE